MDTWEFVQSCGCNIEFVSQKAKELDKIIDTEAEKLSDRKAEERFNARKEEFQLEVLKQLQEEGIKKEGAELSASSPLISDTYNLDGVELHPYYYIPDSVPIAPPYEETELIKNAYSLEWQEINRNTGKRKFVWKEKATLILISNPIGIGKCENISVYLKGIEKPLQFPNGDISEEAFRRQTRFARKGLNVNVRKHYESFLRNLRECPNKKFLTIPKHAGGVTLPNGLTTYISAESVIKTSEVVSLLLYTTSEVYTNFRIDSVLTKANICDINSILSQLTDFLQTFFQRLLGGLYSHKH